jgi:hypothetical protein
MNQLTQELDSIILKNNFLINKFEIQLVLTNNYLLLCENTLVKRATHFCKLSFDLKSEVMYQKANVKY